MPRNGPHSLAIGTAWSSTSKMNRCTGHGGDGSHTTQKWLICSQCAPVCTITRMTALARGWEAWAVPFPTRTHSAHSWTPTSTFTRFPIGLRRSRPAPWKTASSLRPSARCLQAFTASQTITSSWGEGNLSRPQQPQDHKFYTQGQTFPMLLLYQILFQHFFPPVWLYEIEVFLGNYSRTAGADTRGCKAWSMDVYFFKRLLHLRTKQHKLQDFSLLQIYTTEIDILTFGYIPNDAHWGKCYFSKGVVSP